MSKSIYEFTDYKSYLLAWISAQPAQGHGTRGRMAKAIHCQTGFISQILKGSSHLSLEQADLLNSFLGHTREEAHLFLLLVQNTRAGTPSLRKYFSGQISSICERQNILKNLLKTNAEVSKEDQGEYFSSWEYAAVHVLLTIPPFQSKKSISSRLKIPLERTAAVLDFLLKKGLATREGEKFSVGKVGIHLMPDSPLINQHHMNWRLQGMLSLSRASKEDFHYSSVVCISRADAEKIGRLLGETVAQVGQIVVPSKEEDLFSLSLDFFRTAN